MSHTFYLGSLATGNTWMTDHSKASQQLKVCKTVYQSVTYFLADWSAVILCTSFLN